MACPACWQTLCPTGPAFDMTYSYNPAGSWTASHQMSLNGKRDEFNLEDFKACARAVSMKRGRAETIVERVHKVIAQWNDYAEAVGVPNAWREQIRQTHRLDLLK